MDSRNCAVAVVPKAAYQDAQADTSVDGYANIAVRIMERESPWRYTQDQRARSGFET